MAGVDPESLAAVLSQINAQTGLNITPQEFEAFTLANPSARSFVDGIVATSTHIQSLTASAKVAHARGDLTAFEALMSEIEAVAQAQISQNRQFMNETVQNTTLMAQGWAVLQAILNSTMRGLMPMFFFMPLLEEVLPTPRPISLDEEEETETETDETETEATEPDSEPSDTTESDPGTSDPDSSDPDTSDTSDSSSDSTSDGAPSDGSSDGGPGPGDSSGDGGSGDGGDGDGGE